MIVKKKTLISTHKDTQLYPIIQVAGSITMLGFELTGAMWLRATFGLIMLKLLAMKGNNR